MQPHDVVRFLLARGFLSAEDVVAGQLSLEDAIGRNDNLLIRSTTGHAYAFKHAAGDAGAARMLALEAALYEQTSAPGHAVLVALGTHIPRLAWFDREEGVLVTHLAKGARELWELDVPQDALAPIGSALGTVLAVCHAVTGDAIPESLRDRRPPWVLQIHRQDPSLLRDAWPAHLEVIRLIQANAGTCATLDRLHAGWTRHCLIHGDVKLSNLLVQQDARTNAPLQLILLDWETASAGDPAWDVGSAFQLILWHALHSVFNTDDEMPSADPREAFANRLALYRPEILAFLTAYRAATAVEADDALFVRSATWCGARLIQSAYEEASGLEHPSLFSLSLLQLGVNVLADPRGAIRDVLALDIAS